MTSGADAGGARPKPSGTDAIPPRPGQQGEGDASTGIARPKVISPELRALLSRKVDVMGKREVKEHGGGV